MAQRYHRVAQATALFPELKSQELLAGAWRRMPSPFLLLRDQPLLCMGRDQWQGGLPISECCREFEFICALWCSPGKTYCPWTATLELSLSSKGPILAAREKKSPSLSIVLLLLCWITFRAHSWKCHPVERDPNHVLVQWQSLFPPCLLLALLQPLQNVSIYAWFKDWLLLFSFSYIDPADIQMWKSNFYLILSHLDLGYIPCCSKFLCDNFHPRKMFSKFWTRIRPTLNSLAFYFYS